MKNAVDIVLNGVELTVTGTYSPEEPMVMYYKDGSGYPGCHTEFEIEEVLHNDEDIMDLMDDAVLEEAQSAAIEQMNEQ